MKAVGVVGPDAMVRLFDIDEPVVARDGVIVEVMAASVNDVDRGAVAGLLGSDFVGRVTGVGEDVDYIEVGMQVAGVLAPGRSGTFTEMVGVPAKSLAPVPDGVDLAQAAGVGLAGITALDAVSALGSTDLGRTVIHGPVGEVGGFAVQLAKARGAMVAVVTPPAQVDLAWKLGADVVIPEGASAARTIQTVRDYFGGGVDTAIHVAGDLSVAAGVVRKGGKFTSVAATVMDGVRSDAEFIPTIVAPSGHKLADLLFKVAAHRLHSRVGRTASFDQVGDALDADSAESDGRTVLVR